MKEQPKPVAGGPEVVEQMIRDYELDGATGTWGIIRDLLLERRAVGIGRYGMPLTALNGRDALQDLQEELVDAFQYASQCEMEGVRIQYEQGKALLEIIDHIRIVVEQNIRRV